MTTYRPISLSKNLCSCVYIGNVSSFDNQMLIDYLSNFGNIVKFHFRRENFADFQIIEFSSQDQAERFVRPMHEIQGVALDVFSYKDFLNRTRFLKVDEKFFIGPINDSKQIQIIVDFYRKIDPNLLFYTTAQQRETFLLFEMSNQQHVTKIIDRNLKANVTSQRPFALIRPVQPNKYSFKIFTIGNETCQIYIRGLNEKIKESNLIDYFSKRATVRACHIFSNDPSCAVVELADDLSVNQVLNLPVIRLDGLALALSKVPCSIESLLEFDIGQAQIRVTENTNLTEQLESLHRNESNSSSNQSHETNLGWTSPPRRIGYRDELNDFQSNGSNSMKTEEDSSTKNGGILRFYEKIQNELEQIRDDYQKKFDKNRFDLNREFERLLHEDRRVFDKLKQNLKDDRRKNSNKKRSDHKRKYSSDSSES